MNRRDFFKTAGLAAGAATVAGSRFATAQGQPLKQNFKLKYAPHFGMFENHAGKDLVDQINFIADVGFRAFEDNGMKGRSINVQEKIAAALARRGVEMGVFVANTINWQEPTLTTGKPEILEAFLKDIKDSVEVARRVNATWMTVVPGYVDMRQHPDFQRAHVIEALKRAAEIFEPHGLVMVLEPLNFYNHPGLFLTTVPQAFEICKAVNSPACKILDDLYHVQIQEGNLIPNIDKAWDEIGYFQIGDNPGRNEPTTGEIHYQNVFKHIAKKSTDFILGMEHGKSKEGKEGEIKLIEAYAWADDFEI
ncbi:xylose isomerase [candidate division KSB1 bacterium]|nr:TIM barrel protein [candidate division KSB1 bacterium]RQW03438.1 MAG: xylose isomerase [candidate division KSB1 bacterium]